MLLARGLTTNRTSLNCSLHPIVRLMEVHVICFNTSYSAVNLLVAPLTGRRGSLPMELTASSSYKETVKYSVLHTVNLEVHGKLAQVCYTFLLAGPYLFLCGKLYSEQRKLASVENWNFDVFAFRRITEGNEDCRHCTAPVHT